MAAGGVLQEVEGMGWVSRGSGRCRRGWRVQGTFRLVRERHVHAPSLWGHGCTRVFCTACCARALRLRLVLVLLGQVEVLVLVALWVQEAGRRLALWLRVRLR